MYENVPEVWESLRNPGQLSSKRYKGANYTMSWPAMRARPELASCVSEFISLASEIELLFALMAVRLLTTDHMRVSAFLWSTDRDQHRSSALQAAMKAQLTREGCGNATYIQEAVVDVVMKRRNEFAHGMWFHVNDYQPLADALLWTKSADIAERDARVAQQEQALKRGDLDAAKALGPVWPEWSPAVPPEHTRVWTLKTLAHSCECAWRARRIVKELTWAVEAGDRAVEARKLLSALLPTMPHPQSPWRKVPPAPPAPQPQKSSSELARERLDRAFDEFFDEYQKRDRAGDP